MNKESKNDEIIRQILDDQSLSSLNSLKHINKEKGERLQNLLLQHFNSIYRRITYKEYLEIVDKMEKETAKTEIKFKRKSNLYELDDIE